MGWGTISKPTKEYQGVQILGVQPGFTKTNKQKFDVQVQGSAGGGSFSTLDPGKAAQAQALVGQVVNMVVTVNGDFENYDSAYPSGGVAAQPQQQAQQPQQNGQPQQPFTPAVGFVDEKQREMRRVGGVQNATSVLGAFVGSGYYLDDAGALDIERLAGDVITLAGKLTRYTVEGPAGNLTATQGGVDVVTATLPPGVTPEQVAAWAAAQGGEVEVGVSFAEAAEASASDAPY